MSVHPFGCCLIAIVSIGCAESMGAAIDARLPDSGHDASADTGTRDAAIPDGSNGDHDAGGVDAMASDAGDTGVIVLDAGEADAAMTDASDATFDDAGDAGGYNVVVPVAIVSRSLERRDQDCNGVPEECITRSYDADERLIVMRTDDCTGGNAWCFSTVFNREDRALVIGKDEACDGVPECPSHAYTYDAEGNSVRTVVHTGTPESLCASRSPFMCTTFMHPSANVTRAEEDSRCDGTLSYCETRHRDQAGNAVYVERDYDCDGMRNGPDSCLARMFDGAGHEVASGVDENCDGTVDFACRVAAFDDAGRQISGHRDSECNGVPTSECRGETFDSAGNSTERFEDDDCDGTPELLITRTFDEMGHEVSEITRGNQRDCDITSTYDTAGRLVRENFSATCNGGPYCKITVYSPDDRNRTEGRDATCDGIADSACLTRTYDDRERLIGWRQDTDCDGSPDHSCYSLELDLDL